MDTLLELLTISDFNDKIIAVKQYSNNVKKYAYQMKTFLPLFEENWHLPIKYAKYEGKIAYIDWILRSETLYLCLNVTYYSTGLIKSLETVAQCLVLEEITDIRNVKTLSGKKFKKKFIYDKALPAYSVLSDRIISSQKFAVIETSMDRFPMRDQILRKFGLQSRLNII